MARESRTAAEALGRRVDTSTTPDGCHLFIGAKDSGGYGKLMVAGRAHLPHRLAWELAHGPIPAGMWVLHRCDQPACCRVDHLFLGTPADNSADMVAKKRQARGPRSGGAKLTERDVREIRELARLGVPGPAIARQFPVHYVTIRKILRGRIWAHVS